MMEGAGNKIKLGGGEMWNLGGRKIRRSFTCLESLNIIKIITIYN